jgi:hypothetical protein
MSELLYNIAKWFGEVQGGSNFVDFVKMNPKDAKSLSSELSLSLDSGEDYLWGARVIPDEFLLPGTVIIDKLGKRMLY